MGPPLQRVMTAVMGALARRMPRDRGAVDVAEFDMYIDNALQLNEKLTVPEHLYCFSYPCCTTERQPDGKCTPIKSCTEQMFRATAEIIGAMYGVTRGGFVFDETWRDNDGLVNTISARAPFDAPQQECGILCPLYRATTWRWKAECLSCAVCSRCFWSSCTESTVCLDWRNVWNFLKKH